MSDPVRVPEGAEEASASGRSEPGRCRCDGASYFTDEQNAKRHPFIVNDSCPIHGPGRSSGAADSERLTCPDCGQRFYGSHLCPPGTHLPADSERDEYAEGYLAAERATVDVYERELRAAQARAASAESEARALREQLRQVEELCETGSELIGEQYEAIYYVRTDRLRSILSSGGNVEADEPEPSTAPMGITPEQATEAKRLAAQMGLVHDDEPLKPAARAFAAFIDSLTVQTAQPERYGVPTSPERDAELRASLDTIREAERRAVQGGKPE